MKNFNFFKKGEGKRKYGAAQLQSLMKKRTRQYNQR